MVNIALQWVNIGIQCGKRLHENEFYEKDGKAYCVDDFLNLFAPKCKKCRTPITDDYCLVALDADWHVDCFRYRWMECTHSYIIKSANQQRQHTKLSVLR
ncbi:Transforming growth factor beta-1-induced transcript 1 protein [Orchesella cincta]|uniref:Transforming growth factor beta-1-induced transcript 1 protein n=1 Tax=Orchesella cincta TaxID=48709 RepID=A0A1D2MDY6_ORCCI|nr:Transforming growth factor beta-1-induced transcript 1 protein [Orchesella cincta]